MAENIENRPATQEGQLSPKEFQAEIHYYLGQLRSANYQWEQADDHNGNIGTYDLQRKQAREVLDRLGYVDPFYLDPENIESIG